jgi:pheromone shutdown-related protein TraB
MEQDSQQVFESDHLTLVGTAHVSRSSVELVEKVIREKRPAVVAVELDERRLKNLLNPDAWKQTDLFKVIREGNSHLLLTQLVLQSFQRRVSKELGVTPGGEMLKAVEVANELGLKLVCIDRDVRITLKRAWARASWWSVAKVVFAMIGSVVERKSISQDEIEKLKESDALSAALLEFSEMLPDIKESLIDERDYYMAEKLKTLAPDTVVAVVGAGHLPGMKRALNERHDLSELESVPEKGSPVIGWIFPALILLLIGIGAIYGGSSTSQEMILTWILTTGVLSALGALSCLAHPLSILTAFVAAPLTTIHPLLAAGWFSGLTEVWLRKPRVSDLEAVSEDLSTVGGWFRNRVSRILLVVALTNVGASIGSIVATTQLVRALL